MATRAEIRKKHGIVVIESPDVASEKLSKKDSELYEQMIAYIAEQGRKAKGDSAYAKEEEKQSPRGSNQAFQRAGNFK